MAIGLGAEQRAAAAAKAGAKAPKKAKAIKENIDPQATPAPEAPAVDEKVKAKAEAKASTPVMATTEDNDVIGSKSETLEFIAPLCDPSVPDKTDIKNKDGSGTTSKISTGTIVGYRFKSTIDIPDLPDCGIDEGFKGNRMNFVNIAGTRAVKAGEEFDLTPFELGALLSRLEYNALALGGENHVKCTYKLAGAKKKDGTVEKVSDATAVPNVSLRGIDGTVVKTLPMIEVLDYTKSPKSAKGAVKISRKIKPGFEKWEVLCKAATPKARTTTATDNKKVYSDGAAAFMNIYNAKKKRQA